MEPHPLGPDVVHASSVIHRACVVVGGKYDGVGPVGTSPAGVLNVAGPVSVAVTWTPLGVVPRAMFPVTVHVAGYSDPAGTACALGAVTAKALSIDSTRTKKTKAEPKRYLRPDTSNVRRVCPENL